MTERSLWWRRRAYRTDPRLLDGAGSLATRLPRRGRLPGAAARGSRASARSGVRRGRVDRLLRRRAGALPAAAAPSRSSRSISRTRTRAADAARATRSMLRLPRARRSPARRPVSPSTRAGSSSRSGSCASPARARSRPAPPPERSCTAGDHRTRRAPPAARRTQDNRGKRQPLPASTTRSGALHEPLQAAKLALRSVAERVRELDRQISLLDRTSRRSSPPPRHERPACSASPPSMAASYSSPPAQNIERLRSDGVLRPTLRRQPDPRLLRPHRPDTGSTAAATARPTAPST